MFSVESNVKKTAFMMLFLARIYLRNIEKGKVFPYTLLPRGKGMISIGYGKRVLL